MNNCLICGAPYSHVHGYTIGMMGWVCSNQCRDKYNSLLKTIFKDKEPKPMDKSLINQAVELLRNKAKNHREKANDLDLQVKECLNRSNELEKLADDIQRLGSE